MGTDNKYRGMSSFSASKTWVLASVSESENKVNKYPHCLGGVCGCRSDGKSAGVYARKELQQPPGVRLSEAKDSVCAGRGLVDPSLREWDVPGGKGLMLMARDRWLGE